MRKENDNLRKSRLGFLSNDRAELNGGSTGTSYATCIEMPCVVDVSSGSIRETSLNMPPNFRCLSVSLSQCFCLLACSLAFPSQAKQLVPQYA